MKAVIQRVKEAEVISDKKSVAKIEKGIVVFLCVENDDTNSDADFLAEKLIGLRIFNDARDKFNLSIQDIKGQFLVISQFTLSANCQKGRRPSFENAAKPELAEPLYNYFIQKLKASSLKVEAGIFGAMMDIQLTNDGPVTFILNSR